MCCYFHQQEHLVTPIHVLMAAIVLSGSQEQPTHVSVSMDSQETIVKQVSL